MSLDKVNGTTHTHLVSTEALGASSSVCCRRVSCVTEVSSIPVADIVSHR